MSKPIGAGNNIKGAGHGPPAHAGGPNKGGKPQETRQIPQQDNAGDKISVSPEAVQETKPSGNDNFKVPDWIKQDDARDNDQVKEFKAQKDRVFQQYEKQVDQSGGKESQADRQILDNYKAQQNQTIDKMERQQEEVARHKDQAKQDIQAEQNEAQGGGKGLPPGLAKKAGGGKGLPPGLAKKAGEDGKGLPPGLAKKVGEDGKGLPPGIQKQIEGKDNASEIAKNQDKAVDQLKDNQAKEEAEKPAPDPVKDREPVKPDNIDNNKTATDDKPIDQEPVRDGSVKDDPVSIEKQAVAEAAQEANTPEAQANIAVEKQIMMHTRVEVKKKVEIISTRGPGENRQEIEQVQSMLERLEAHEAGEDHARMLRGTPLETNTENSFELKKKFASAQLFKPAKEANFDQMIANDCHAVLQEIQSGNQMGANRHTSIPVVGLSVNGNSEKGKENNGPSVYNQATPGGALGKLMRDYQEASHLGAGISSQTRDLIRNTLRIAGADNLESTITHQPGRALNTFFTNQG